MKKNKITKLLFTNDCGRYPDSTCELLFNFVLNFFNGLLIIIAIALSFLLLTPLALLHPNISFFPAGPIVSIEVFLGFFGSLFFIFYLFISTILFTLRSNTLKNIISTIKDKTCFKIEWKE